jgi:hypothetical protein
LILTAEESEQETEEEQLIRLKKGAKLGIRKTNSTNAILKFKVYIFKKKKFFFKLFFF